MAFINSYPTFCLQPFWPPLLPHSAFFSSVPSVFSACAPDWPLITKSKIQSILHHTCQYHSMRVMPIYPKIVLLQNPFVEPYSRYRLGFCRGNSRGYIYIKHTQHQNIRLKAIRVRSAKEVAGSRIQRRVGCPFDIIRPSESTQAGFDLDLHPN